MRRFGLIGEHLPHSFSGRYFASKFEAEGIADCRYDLYELSSIEQVESLIDPVNGLDGFNVTIPYKQQIIPYLDALSAEAEAIGAVNCVCREGDWLVGYNTDVIGFRDSLLAMLKESRPTQALILGTGGAALAVEYILRKMEIEVTIVSRRSGSGRISYEDITHSLIAATKLIVNATPLGTFPDVESYPNIPYEQLNDSHYLYDLVYNPPLTQFLAKGAARGAKICNGEAMLVGQAEASWDIWNR